MSTILRLSTITIHEVRGVPSLLPATRQARQGEVGWRSSASLAPAPFLMPQVTGSILWKGQGTLMHKSLIAILLLLLIVCGTLVDGFFYSAHAQCAASDKIYIDPRLVPQRPSPPEGSMGSLMASRFLSPEAKQQLLQEYAQRNQPIVVPYGTGKVLVHPTNPCIQQYIP